MILSPYPNACSSSSIWGGPYRGKTQIETGVNLKVETESQRERENLVGKSMPFPCGKRL